MDNRREYGHRRHIQLACDTLAAEPDILRRVHDFRGILLRRVYADPVDQDTICIHSDLEQFVQKKQQRKAQEQKKKAKEMEF